MAHGFPVLLIGVPSAASPVQAWVKHSDDQSGFGLER